MNDSFHLITMILFFTLGFAEENNVDSNTTFWSKVFKPLIQVRSKSAKPYMSSPAEDIFTLALIKPDAYPKRAEIIEAIKAAGFTIVKCKETKEPIEKFHGFYAEHKGKPFYDALCSFMSSGPLVAMVLSKPNAVPEWRATIGPTNTAVAKEKAPESLRAKFGTDATKNACHGSASPAEAKTEIEFWFPGFFAEAH